MSNSTLIKTIANIISGNLLSLSGKTGKPLDQIIKRENLIYLARLFEGRKISNQGLQKVLEHLSENPDLEAEKAVEELGVLQISDDQTLLAFVNQAIAENPKQVEQYKSGKVQLIGFFVGQCMKLSGGQGDPAKFNQLLTEALNKLEVSEAVSS